MSTTGQTGYLTLLLAAMRQNQAGTVTPPTAAELEAANIQAFDGDLKAIAAITATNGFLKKTGLNTWVLDTTGYLTSITSSQVTTALGYTPVTNARTLTINGVTYDLTADRSWTVAGGLSSFNTRTGAITLLSSDVTTALGFTPYNATNPAGYISSYTETDPTVGSHIKAITTTNISNWNTAYGWGNHASAGYLTGITSSQINTALGFTPENAANKGVANGYASLDGSGLIPSTQLPSYVDDVLEYATLAGFPATGTTGKIYIDLATNKVYRWSGTVYIEVSPTVGTIWGGITGTLANQTDLQTALDAKVPTNRTLTINGTPFDLTANRSWTINSMVYPAAGIAVSTGTAWGTSITDNSTNWNTAYSSRISSLTVTGSSGAATLVSNVLNIPTYTLAGLGGQASSTNLTSLSGLTYVSASFVKMTAAGTFSLDTNTYYLASNPSGYTNNTGTVTSVSGTGTVSGLSISGTVTTTGNITLSGTLAVTASNFSSQTANTFLAAPTGLAGVPTFRTIVAADIPTLNQSTTGSAGSVANSLILKADTGTTEGTDLYTYNGSAAKTLNIVAGSNITITKVAGQWTIAGSVGGTTLNGTGFVRMTGTTPSYITGTSSQFVKADGTLDSTVYSTTTGTVTSVAALTLGTTGTDLSSSVATGTTTAVITLNVPSASAANRGVLTSADWTTFNNKQAAISLTTTGSSGAATFSANTLNVPNYTLSGLGGQPLATNLTSLAALSYVSASFVKMTAAGTFALDTNTYYLASNPSGYTNNTGTVTSVGLSLPAIFTVTGSPVTTSGTLTATLASQTANTFFAAPNGAAGAPAFRAIVAADIPTLNQNTTGTAATITGVYSGTLTSAQITTALTYTPYNSTNPSGYISANQSITLSGDVSGTGSTAITTTLATITQSTGASFVKITLDTKGRVTGNTAVGSSDITTALGYTPYNSTNPSGYTNNTGTVTSVGGTGTVSGLTLSGTVTTSGNLTLGGTLAVTASNFSSQLANTFLAAPNGAAGVPTFRTIVAADIPTLNQNTTGTAASITGVYSGTLTSSQITTGLGFTPYNSTNPSGYISSYTETDTFATVTGRGATTSTNITLSGGTTTLSNVTSNIITFGTAGVAAPTFTTRSAGTKLVLYDALTSSQVDFALGIEGSTMWFSTYNSASGFFKWYGGITQAASLSGTGTFTCVSLTETSSIRYKENVVTLQNSLEAVTKLRGVEYNRIGSVSKEVGVIAEEVADILPEIITYNTTGQIDSVSYGRLTAVLIEAVKEQQKQIDELKALLGK